jgi:protein TonB
MATITRRALPNYYDILGVPPGSSTDAIEMAFRSLVRRLRDEPGSSDRLHQIQLAYRALRDPEKRRVYDAALSGAGPAKAAQGAAPDARRADGPALFERRAPEDAGTAARGGIVPESSGAAASAAVATQATDEAPSENHSEEPEEKSRRPLYLALAGVGALLLALPLSGVLQDTGPEQSSPAAGASRTAEGAVGGSQTQQSGADGSVSSGQAAQPAPGTEAGLEVDTTPVPLPADLPRLPPPSAQAAAAAPGVVPDLASVESEAAAPASPPPEVAQEVPPTAVAGAPVDASPTVAVSEPAATPPRPNLRAPARWISGGLQNSDNPNGRFEGRVGVRFSVLPSGRVTGCRTASSSGNAQLDATTCRLLQERLRFSPARDAEGRPYTIEVGNTYTWSRARRRRR